MKIDKSMLDQISDLASIRLEEQEEKDLLESLNSLVEDFSSLHDFYIEEEIDISTTIFFREDQSKPYLELKDLYSNFPLFIKGLLVAPKLTSEE